MTMNDSTEGSVDMSIQKMIDTLVFEDWRVSIRYLSRLRRAYRKELKRRTKEKLDALHMEGKY